MKRRLSPKIKWDAESVKLEQLDWEGNPKDFDRLCEYVIDKLNVRLKNRTVEKIIPMSKLRVEIRRAAKCFEEKYVSLPFFVYMRMKEVVALELRKSKD